jgi:hypothetical protein
LEKKMKATNNGLFFIILTAVVLMQHSVFAEPPRFNAQILERFPSADAYQAIAVDTDYFYTVNNRQISRHLKGNGELVEQWDEASKLESPLIHLDSGVIIDGELIGVHSNYPRWPMRSSIEFFDSATLQHKRRRDFGVFLGSMTWLDRYDDAWWGAFGNYDIVQVGMTEPYGETRNTVVVKFDEQFNVAQQWRLPDEIIERITPMSNSGGSWGADDLLYLTGHDHPEIYVMKAPVDSEVLSWIATVQVPGLNGQGIAWDRSSESNELWAILRASRQALKIRMPKIKLD